eukprot:TRINITY_DN5534_c0_g2_i2.p1 TRINITY_DN5534_c0_g2~~TRINITY_DN5534_c0_g2_i2.p1  ORF type:complete len:869 (+),score=277.49 TRINITY_DN5534_c0_g2_i2:62-2608(+)
MLRSLVGSEMCIRDRPQSLVWVWGQGVRNKLPEEEVAVMWEPRPVSDFDSNNKSMAGITSSSHNIAAWTDETGGSVYIWMAGNSERWNLEPAIKPGAVLVQAACSDTHIVATLDDGSVLSWGSNEAGQLGTGDRTPHGRAVLVPQAKDAVWLACESGCTAAVLADGRLMTWGDSKSFRLGHGHDRTELRPRRVAALKDEFVVQVAMGDGHTAAVTDAGAVWCWGLASQGRCGSAGDSACKTPQQVAGVSGVVQIGCGAGHTLALQGNGSVFSWGANQSGQLGHGNANSSFKPRQVVGLPGTPAVQVAAGGNSSMVLLEDSTVWGFGSNSVGQLGTGSSVKMANTATLVSGFESVQVHSLCCGKQFGVALVSLKPKVREPSTKSKLMLTSGYQKPGVAVGSEADKELVGELCTLHGDVSETQAVRMQLEHEIESCHGREHELEQEVTEWKGLLAEMNGSAAKARKIEEDESKFYKIEIERMEEHLGPLRGIEKARDDELQDKKQQLEEKLKELAGLKEALSEAAQEQADAETDKQALEYEMVLVQAKMEEERERTDASKKVIEDTLDHDARTRQRREQLRTTLYETQQQMLLVPKSERKLLKKKSELLDQELDALTKGVQEEKDLSQETAAVRDELQRQMEIEIGLREELEEQMIRWQDEKTSEQQATVSLAQQKKHMKDLEMAAGKGKKEADEEARAAVQQVSAAHMEVINLGNKELEQQNAPAADVSADEKVMVLVSELFQNANVKHSRLLDNYEVAALLERLWLRVGRKPSFMQQPGQEGRLTGIVQKTMQPFDEGRSMIDFAGYLRMISAEPWNEIFVENNVCETLSGSVDEYIRQTERMHARGR